MQQVDQCRSRCISSVQQDRHQDLLALQGKSH
uniref:Uncharacterized protein n=1 Tax=Arundo donax TaxID=35708 RepID=A0A0A8Z3Y0_ARUDO